MYRKILVALEHSVRDQNVIQEITKLATLLHSELLLVHVADGWAARNYDALQMAESEEMRKDREYLSSVAARMTESGLTVKTVLALGNPPEQILKTAAAESCDLIAMTTHGHRLFLDILLGSTIEHVRHESKIPLLLVHAGA
jgi:nucleotide-binding universal stress UspA family protein